MNPSLIAILVVVLAGGATALQAPTNARLATAVASPVNAALVSFAVGTVALGVVAAILHTRPDVAATRALPWYAWLGGAYGACFVVAAAWGVPRQPLNIGRIAGVGLVLAGVLLVRRS